MRLGEDGTIYDPDMNSYNHYAYGAVCQWLFEGVAGVAPVRRKAGLRRGHARPADPARAVTGRHAWHDCRHGRIEAGWALEGDTVTYRVTLPQGTQGR